MSTKIDSCYKLSKGMERVHLWYTKYKSEIVWPLLIFVHTRVDVEAISAWLVASGVRACGIHGGMDLDERNAAQLRMKDGSLDCVVCTDAWQAGVDIPNLRGIVKAIDGSAPIGLKQRAGRGTRLHDGKSDFTIWDLALLKEASGLHRLRRIEHYLDGGYEVQGKQRRGGRTTPVNGVRTVSAGDADLAEMLAQKPQRRSTPVVQEPEHSHSPEGWGGVPFFNKGESVVIGWSVFAIALLALVKECGII